MSDSTGQVSLDSLTEDIKPPVKAGWFSQPYCGRCGVRLAKGFTTDGQDKRTLTEAKCGHCGAVNRLD